MLFEDAKDMLKRGRAGTWVVPVKARARFVTRMSQLVEWRYLSFLEARMLPVEDADCTIGANCVGGAELHSAASLRYEMMT